MIDMSDKVIEEGVVDPSEAILKIKNLKLREKLALWSTRNEKVHFYRKMDITEYLIVLDNVKSYKLDEGIQWKLLRLPFDVSNSIMMDSFSKTFGLEFDEQWVYDERIKVSEDINYFSNFSFKLMKYYVKLEINITKC